MNMDISESDSDSVINFDVSIAPRDDVKPNDTVIITDCAGQRLPIITSIDETTSIAFSGAKLNSNDCMLNSGRPVDVVSDSAHNDIDHKKTATTTNSDDDNDDESGSPNTGLSDKAVSVSTLSNEENRGPDLNHHHNDGADCDANNTASRTRDKESDITPITHIAKSVEKGGIVQPMESDQPSTNSSHQTAYRNTSLCLLDHEGITPALTNPMTAAISPVLVTKPSTKMVDISCTSDDAPRQITHSDGTITEQMLSVTSSLPAVSPIPVILKQEARFLPQSSLLFASHPLNIEKQANSVCPGDLLVNCPTSQPGKSSSVSSDKSTLRSKRHSCSKAGDVISSSRLCHETNTSLDLLPKDVSTPSKGIPKKAEFSTPDDVASSSASSQVVLSLTPASKSHVQSSQLRAIDSIVIKLGAAIIEDTTEKHQKPVIRTERSVTTTKGKSNARSSTSAPDCRSTVENVIVSSAQPVPAYENISPVPLKRIVLPDYSDMSVTAQALIQASYPTNCQPKHGAMPHGYTPPRYNQYTQLQTTSFVHSQPLPASSMHSHFGHTRYTQHPPGYASYTQPLRGRYPQNIYPPIANTRIRTVYPRNCYSNVQQTARRGPRMARRMVNPAVLPAKMPLAVMPTAYSFPKGTVSLHTQMALRDYASQHLMSEGPPCVTVEYPSFYRSRGGMPAYSGMVTCSEHIYKSAPQTSSRDETSSGSLGKICHSQISKSSGKLNIDYRSIGVFSPPPMAAQEEVSASPPMAAHEVTYVLTDDYGIGTLTPAQPKQKSLTASSSNTPARNASRYFTKGKISLVVPTGRIDDIQNSSVMSPPPVPDGCGRKPAVTTKQHKHKHSQTVVMKHPEMSKLLSKTRSPAAVTITHTSEKSNVDTKNEEAALQMNQDETIAQSQSLSTSRSSTPTREKTTCETTSASVTSVISKTSTDADGKSESSLSVKEEFSPVAQSTVYRSPGSDIYSSPQKTSGGPTLSQNYKYSLQDGITHELTKSFSSMSCDEISPAASTKGEIYNFLH